MNVCNALHSCTRFFCTGANIRREYPRLHFSIGLHYGSLFVVPAWWHFLSVRGFQNIFSNGADQADIQIKDPTLRAQGLYF